MSKGTVPITGTITTTNELDTYPTHWDKYAKGGFRTVTDTTARDSITLERRTEGMQVFVRDIKQLHQLVGGTDNTKWVTLLTIDSNNKIIINNDLNLQKYIIQGEPTTLLPNAIALSTKEDGYLVNNSGVVNTTTSFDPSGITLSKDKILIGGSDNKAMESQTLKIENLPADLSSTGIVKFDSTSSTLKIAVPDVDYPTTKKLEEIAAQAKTYSDNAESSASASSKFATTSSLAAAESTGAASLAKGYAEDAGLSMTGAGASALSASGFANDASNSASNASSSATTAAAASKIAGERRDEAAVSATSAANSLKILQETGLNALPNSGDVDFKGYKGINFGDAVADTDAVNFGQLKAYSGGGINSVVGTNGEIKVTGTADVVISMASDYAGQTSINKVGTIATGKWNASVVEMKYGGTNANLTPSDGGAIYSTSTSLAISSFVKVTNTGLGLGTSTTNAPIQFSNTSANRKIILAQQTNNDHEFFGFGYNAGAKNILRYQISAPTSVAAHVFYSGMDSTSSKELMRITGSGNVGIGTSTPNAALHFSNQINNRKIVLYETQDNSHEFIGFGTNLGILRYQINNTSNSSGHIFYAAVDGNNSNELMRLTGDGHLGIGTSVPTGILSVGHAPQSPSLATVFNNYSDSKTLSRMSFTGQEWNDSSFTSSEGVAVSLALNRTNLRAICFKDTSYERNSTNAMFRLSFSSSIPSIESVDQTQTGFKRLNINAASVYSNTNSVYTPSGGSWLASSDKRVKRNIKKYDKGLTEILKLNPVTFQFNEYSDFSIDIQKKENIGFIADEVEKIMPECIGSIPNEKYGETRSLDITPMTHALVNAVKELTERIIYLEKKLKQ